MQNSDFRTRITSLYGSQTSSVVLCMQNSVISTRIKSLYGFQGRITWRSFSACKTAGFSTHELLVSILVSLSPHLRFLHANQRLLFWTSYKSLWVFQDLTNVALCMHNNAWIWNRITQGANWVPALKSVSFVPWQNSDFSWHRLASLYGSQSSSVDFEHT